jgi:hypothetical protein
MKYETVESSRMEEKSTHGQLKKKAKCQIDESYECN